MGATTFVDTKQLPKKCKDDGTLSKELKKAFTSLVEDAQWEHGHGGYSGTIAEKTSFKYARHFEAKDYAFVDAFVSKRLDEDDLDKWGPAEAITYEKDGKLFADFYGVAPE